MPNYAGLSNWPKLLLFCVYYLSVSAIFIQMNSWWPIGQALWPYTGIGLAGVLFFGLRIWPLIALLNFSLQLLIYHPGLATAQACAEVIEVCTAGWLLQRARFDFSLQRLRDALILLVVGATMGSFLGAGLKQLFLLLFHTQSWHKFLFNWWAWWRGDALGVVIFTPILLVWMKPQETRLRATRTEAMMLLSFATLLSIMILRTPNLETTSHSPLVDIYFLLVFWAAMRFGVRGAVSLSGLAALVTALDTLHQLGNAPLAAVNASLLELWAFLSVLSGSSLLMATTIMERERASDRNRVLAQILEATPDFVGIARPNGDIFFLNRSAKALLNHDTTPEKARIADLHPPEIGKKILEEFIPTALKEGVWTGESVFLRRGKQIPVSQVILPHKSPDGKIEFLSTIARDLSERKQMEDALRAAAAGVSEGTGKDFFQLLVQHLALALRVKYVLVGALKHDHKDVVETLAIFSNGTLQPNTEYHLAGTPCASVVGQQLCYYPAGIAALFPEDEMLREMGVDSYMGIPLFSSTGESIGLLVALHDKPIENLGLATSVLQIYSTRAATELERLHNEESLRISEQKLQQAQKMQAIGNLAGGIAHDFNNILTVIKGCTRLALNTLPGNMPAYEDLLEVQKAAERAATLTGHLLAFSRQNVVHPRSFEINAHIMEIARMLGRMLGEDIELNMQLAPEAGCVNIDPGQFDQIVMNLAVNARDAMPNGGRLEFITTREMIDERLGQSLDLPPGEYTLFKVRDNGVGIEPDSLRHIFEPFYTTKPNGMGLGLSISRAIVETYGGRIWADNRPEGGAVLRFVLPLAQAMKAA